jgi:protein-L-isoaspartate(D-aspartate) O-methyltransferase
VLAAMRAVPRDRFISPEYADHAYDDGPLPIGAAQTISQPYIVALMSQVAALDGHERVLEIGTGCGYQAAVLARLAQEVYSVESISMLHERARVILAAMGVTNVHLRCGDGSDGWPEAGVGGARGEESFDDSAEQAKGLLRDLVGPLPAEDP